MKELPYSRRVALDETWDVIVAGGGPAGCAAAAAAAREGARTLLIERTCGLGGMGTAGLVPAWCPFSDHEKIIYRGLAEKVFRTATAGLAHIPPERLDWVPIDPERLKRVYDDLLTSAGVEIRFDSFLAGVETNGGGRVTAVLVASKAGLTAYGAKTYVDATGDGDLAAWAGAGFSKGGPGGDLQPATLCFALTNVNMDAFRNGPNLHSNNPKSPIHAMLASKRYPLIPDAHLCCSIIGPGTVGFNAGHLFQVDNTDTVSVTHAMVQGRRMAGAYREGLAEFHAAAFGQSLVGNTAALLGARETRRIIGEYELTLADYLARRSFEDEICRNSYYIDVHTAPGQGHEGHRYGPGESHGVPYRCLIPRGLSNVLVAGRCISTDRPVQGSTRVMPTALATGEAAGVAAALSARGGFCDVREVKPARLRDRLREHGVWLP